MSETTTAAVKILVATLKGGRVVTAKQLDFGVYPLTYASETQAEKAAAKLRAKGVVCEVIWNRGRVFWVAPVSGFEPAAPRGQADCGGGGVHVQTWVGSATVTDMTNAGKTGKRCRVLRVSGASWDEWAGDDVQKLAARLTRQIIRLLNELDTANCFAMVRDRLTELVDEARADGVPEGYLSIHDEEIRGIDAPRPVLTAGVEGVWSGSVDEGGVSLHALDDVNQWRECTHGQTGAAAYKIASAVWGRVKEAKTLHEASSILRDAGCRLHGWCGLD
jgi:hypothetical protein